MSAWNKYMITDVKTSLSYAICRILYHKYHETE
jgi:hypothetical protein